MEGAVYWGQLTYNPTHLWDVGGNRITQMKQAVIGRMCRLHTVVTQGQNCTRVSANVRLNLYQLRHCVVLKTNRVQVKMLAGKIKGIPKIFVRCVKEKRIITKGSSLEMLGYVWKGMNEWREKRDLLLFLALWHVMKSFLLSGLLSSAKFNWSLKIRLLIASWSLVLTLWMSCPVIQVECT